MNTITARRKTSQSRLSKLGWIGVDIGAAVLKIAQVARSAQHGWQICFAQIVPLPPDSMGSPDALASALSEVLHNHRRWRLRPAACSLPWSATELRTAELPPGSPAEMKQLAAGEVISEQLSAADEQEVTHWPARPSRVEGQLSTVHILSVGSGLATAAAQRLQAAGLECRVVDGRPFSLARAVSLSPSSEPGRTEAAVDWGFNQLAVTLVRDRVPYFTRVLREEGLKHVLASIQAGLKLNHIEATALLRQFTMDDSVNVPGNRQVYDAVAGFVREPLRKVALQVERTISFATQMDGSLQPARLWLFGGGGMIGGVDQLLASHLDIPTEPWALPSTTAGPSKVAVAGPLVGEAAALSALGAPL